MSQIPIRIRNLRPTDHGFVYAYWLNSFEPYRDKRIARDLYYQEHHTAIGRILALPDVTTLARVATSEQDDDLLFGFVVSGLLPMGHVLDYVFVKPVYRRMGVARALVASLPAFDAYTHHTEFSRFVVGRAAFDPYRFYFRA